MATQVEQKLLTAEDLWNLPHDGKRYELVEGALHEMPSTGGEHGIYSGTLHGYLGHHILTQNLGRVIATGTGFIIQHAPDSVRAPDCAFVAQERLPQPIPEKYFDMAPDLVVEVVSPNDKPKEVLTKVGEWLEAGVRLVWVVQPKTRQITVYRSLEDVKVRREEDVLEGEDVVPGFTLEVAKVFA